MGSDETSRRSGDFFDVLSTWSDSKHKILSKYLDACLRIRSSYINDFYVVDGFAGAGKYGDIAGEGGDDGSPLIIARTLRESQRHFPKLKLSMVAVERQADRARQLQQHLVTEGLSGYAQVISGDFLSSLPQISSILSDAPSLFFIDPFGIKESHVDDLREILQRPDTEIMINFNSRRLGMLAGFEDSFAKDAVGKRKLVTTILGCETESEWINEYKALGQDFEAWVEWAVTRYVRELSHNSLGKLRYIIPFPIRQKVGGPVKYHLIFGTRSSKAMVPMNDILCAEHDDLFKGIRLDRQVTQLGLLDGPTTTPDIDRLRELVDWIWLIGQQLPSCSRDDLIEQLILHRPLSFQQKHYRYAIDRLIEQGRVDLVGDVPKAQRIVTFKS